MELREDFTYTVIVFHGTYMTIGFDFDMNKINRRATLLDETDSAFNR